MKSLALTVALLTLSLIIQPDLAIATLGEPETSVENERVLVMGAKKVSAENGYTVHEITSGGNTLREYVSSSGLIFAITWRGLSHPDLSVALGTYYSEYNTIANTTPRLLGRQPTELRTSQIGVIKSGHMRDVRGKAYIARLLPNGVTPESLQ